MIMIELIMAILAVIVALYVCTSLILLKFPNIIHKRKKIRFQARHISHRGGAGENLENTIAAFKHAYDVGTDMLEIDCQLTKDGEVVVAHDNTLTRCSGHDECISDLNFSELPQLCDTIRVEFYPSHTTQCTCDDRHIPLLRDVLIAFPNTPLNIDIKRNDDILIQKTSSLLREFEREHITAWGNISKVVTEKLYKHNSNIPLIFSYGRVIFMLLCFYTGLLPFVPLKESFLELIMPTITFFDKASCDIPLKRRLYIRFMDMVLMRPALFEHLRKRGIQTYLYVLNEEHQFYRAFEKGASGVMTDFPQKLRRFLRNNPQYTSSMEDTKYAKM